MYGVRSTRVLGRQRPRTCQYKQHTAQRCLNRHKPAPNPAPPHQWRQTAKWRQTRSVPTPLIGAKLSNRHTAPILSNGAWGESSFAAVCPAFAPANATAAQSLAACEAFVADSPVRSLSPALTHSLRPSLTPSLLPLSVSITHTHTHTRTHTHTQTHTHTLAVTTPLRTGCVRGSILDNQQPQGVQRHWHWNWCSWQMMSTRRCGERGAA